MLIIGSVIFFYKGVEVFTVGVGIRQDDKILNEIASEPKSQHFFSTPHPARLTDVLHVIKKKICKGRPWFIKAALLLQVVVINSGHSL